MDDWRGWPRLSPHSPRWRADGQELYYLALDGQMMAVPIAVTGTTLAPGTPVALFPTRIDVSGSPRQFDVARDGRFLIAVLDEATSAPITLLQNWRPEATP